MSSAPPGILRLASYITNTLDGRYVLGIVGDSNHRAGYHLGPDRTPQNDSSERLPRDRNGARRYPNYASAIDIGMGFARSRSWLATLIVDCRAGEPYTRDVREVIGSLDGREALYFDSQSGFRAFAYLGSGHVSHSHVSFFRDSAEQDQSTLLRSYLEPPTLEDDMPVINKQLKSGFAYDTSGDNRIDPENVTVIAGEWANESASVPTLGKATLAIGTHYGNPDQKVRLRIEYAERNSNGKEWFPRVGTFHDLGGDSGQAFTWINLPDGSYGAAVSRVPFSNTDSNDAWPVDVSLFYGLRRQ